MDTIDVPRVVKRSTGEICTLSEIEATLDRLIENQSMLNKIQEHSMLDKIKEHYNFSIELEALCKTQESLQSHLFFLGDAYESIQKSIRERLSAKTLDRIYQKAVTYQNLSNFTLGSFHRLFQPSSFRIRKRRKTPISAE